MKKVTFPPFRSFFPGKLTAAGQVVNNITVRHSKSRACQLAMLALACILASAQQASAQPTLVLTDEHQVYGLGSHIEILEDAGGSLTLAEVSKPEYDSRFIAHTSPVPNFGFSLSAFWVRLRVKSASHSRSPWALQLHNPNMDFVDLYVLNAAGKVSVAKHSGRMRPLQSGDFFGEHPVFLISFPRASTQTIYMRFQGEESVIIPLRLLSMTSFIADVGSSHISNGILLGILVIMLLYNLFLFVSLRDKNYLYFVLSIAAYLLFSVSFLGIGYRYLWPNLVTWNKLTLPLSAGLLVLALLKFSDLFLMAKERMAGIHKAIMVMMILVGGFVIGTFFLNYPIFIQAIVLATIVNAALVVTATMISSRQGYRPARFLLLGFSILAVGVIVFLLVRLGRLPSTPLTGNGFAYGGVALILLMALALADRIKILKAEKEESDQSLRKSEEQVRILSRATEQSPALILITDLRGNIEYANPRFEEVTGYTFAEVRGKNPRLLKSGETPRAVYEELWRTIASGEAWRGEWQNRKKNGELYWESALICPIKNEAGEITHYLGIKEDITEHKELQDQLFQVQKMESIGTLAGGIAHDFNNILTVIKGYSDFALSRLDKGHPLYNDISIIQSAGEKAENLTRQILAFSRKQIYHPQVVDLNRIIRDMENMALRLIGEDIRIEMSLAPELPAIKADPSQIEQICVNLLVNARDAINLRTDRAGEKKITIETGTIFLDEDYVRQHMGSKKGLHILFAISDTGTGINEDIRKKIFDPFFTTKAYGTGLGLATVYGIVKQNEANILLTSEPGTGSTFKIYWPAVVEKPPVVSGVDLVGADLHGSERVLLAEDESSVAGFVYAVLKKAGYQVTVARNGKEALDLAARQSVPFDLLLTDLVMPDMNGKELSEKIKEILPTIRILFSSGYTDSYLDHSGALDDAIDFLQKPYSMNALLKKVRSVLSK